MSLILDKTIDDVVSNAQLEVTSFLNLTKTLSDVTLSSTVRVSELNYVLLEVNFIDEVFENCSI